MMDFKVEWVSKSVRREDFTDAPIAKGLGTIEDSFIPVVRLAEVEKLIAELEWAMRRLLVERGDVLQRLHGKSPDDMRPIIAQDLTYQRAQACLASVAAWREGQEKETL